MGNSESVSTDTTTGELPIYWNEEKEKLPAYVPILSQAEGTVHAIANSEMGSHSSLPENGRYLFYPSRDDPESTSARVVKGKGKNNTKSRLFFVRSRRTARSPSSKYGQQLFAMLDKAKAMSQKYKHLEVKRRRALEDALEQIARGIDSQLSMSSGAGLRLALDKVITGADGKVVDEIVSSWLQSMKVASLSTKEKSHWLKVRKDVLKDKPWRKLRKKVRKVTRVFGALSPGGASQSGGFGLSSLVKAKDMASAIKDKSRFASFSIGADKGSAPVQKLQVIRPLLADVIEPLELSQADEDSMVLDLQAAFEELSESIFEHFHKYAAMDNDDDLDAENVSRLEFQICVLEMNIQMDQEDADHAYSASCGFKFEKDNRPMDANLFAHSLLRLAHSYDAHHNDDNHHRPAALDHHLRTLVHKLYPPQQVLARKAARSMSHISSKNSVALDEDGNVIRTVTLDLDLIHPVVDDLSTHAEEEKVKALTKLQGEIDQLFPIVEDIFDGLHEGNVDVHGHRSLSREKFIKFVEGADIEIDNESADNVFSDLCGFSFERNVKTMGATIFVHALVHLAHTHALFTHDEGVSFDSCKTHRHLRSLVRKLNGDDTVDPPSDDEPVPKRVPKAPRQTEQHMPLAPQESPMKPKIKRPLSTFGKIDPPVASDGARYTNFSFEADDGDKPAAAANAPSSAPPKKAVSAGPPKVATTNAVSAPAATRKGAPPPPKTAFGTPSGPTRKSAGPPPATKAFGTPSDPARKSAAPPPAATASDAASPILRKSSDVVTEGMSLADQERLAVSIKRAGPGTHATAAKKQKISKMASASVNLEHHVGPSRHHHHAHKPNGAAAPPPTKQPAPPAKEPKAVEDDMVVDDMEVDEIM